MTCSDSLKDEPQTQWDHITTDMHTKDPWHGFMGEKHVSLCMKTSALLDDCIELHKLTIFICDTAERQKSYDEQLEKNLIR